MSRRARARGIAHILLVALASAIARARASHAEETIRLDVQSVVARNRSFFDVDLLDGVARELSAHNALHRIDPRRMRAAERGRALLDTGFVVRAEASARAAGERVVVRVSAPGATPNATFAEHWLAAYSPANADVRRTAPVKYVLLMNVTNGQYAATGEASVEFELITHRADTYDFVLFATMMNDHAGDVGTPSVAEAVAIARSDPVMLTNAVAPVWPRVTLPPGYAGASAHSVAARVTWQSGRNASHGAELVYRVGDGSYTRVPASTTTYDASDLCGEPASGFGYRHPGYIHSADVSNVRAGDVVEYFIRDAHEASARFEMVMPPAEGVDTKTTLALFADMGRGSSDDAETWRAYGRPAINVTKALEMDARDGSIDAVFLFGDLSYATGYASIWDEWSAQIEPWASRVPFISNMGNHEYDYTNSAWPEDRVSDLYGGRDSGGECGVPATRLYPTPRASPDEDWFAVTIGSIRVVSMSTEVDFSPTSAQGRWIERELSSIDRTRTPWVIFAGHRPGVIDSTDGPEHRDAEPGMKNPSDLSVMDELQRHVWPLLVKYEVNAAFWGHNHAYQRSCAWKAIGEGLFNSSNGCVANSVINADTGVATYDNPMAPVSVLVGTGGARHTRNGVGHAFTEKSFYEFGYVRLTAFNRTHLYGEYQEAGSAPARGDILDKFMIIQPIREDSTSIAEKLERALAEVKTWRIVTRIMAFFVCLTLGIGAWVLVRHWRGDASRHRFTVLASSDDGL